MHEHGWTWDEVLAMPADVVIEFRQMSSIRAQIEERKAK